MVLLENENVSRVPYGFNQFDVFVLFICGRKVYLVFLHLVSLFPQFLNELARMFRKARNHGSVNLTMKRCKFPREL